VILDRQYFSEEDARPVFKQIASALLHLHKYEYFYYLSFLILMINIFFLQYSLNIIHRDIKPENVLILDDVYPVVAKLLDFGLSKHANLGSMAKTFVGTPCYLAPEVEQTASGQGGTYGSPADCWGLGAVLYVMLVARFPEFDRDHGIMKLRLPDTLWKNKSPEVKDLITSLMTHDPALRLTARGALQHVWLKEYRELDSNLPRPNASSSMSNYDVLLDNSWDDERPNATSRKASDPSDLFPSPTNADSINNLNANAFNPTNNLSSNNNNAMVVRPQPKMLSPNQLQFDSLLGLQT
jgi:serine/threonine protein kinase